MKLEELLNKNDISLEVLRDEKNPDYFAHRERMLNLYKDGYIAEQQIKAIVSVAPNIASAVKEVASVAGKSQIEAINAQKSEAESLIDVLKILAEKAESDQTREAIGDQAVKMNSDNNATTGNMNKSNNNTWKWVGGILLALVAGLAGWRETPA